MPSKNLIRLSVVIPTSGKLDSLTAVLKSLVTQEDQNFIVFVVNDSPTVSDAEATVALVNATKDRLRLVLLGSGYPSGRPYGAARARNAGIAAAATMEGDRILFLDDDCVCPPMITAKHRLESGCVIGFRTHLLWEHRHLLTEEMLAAPLHVKVLEQLPLRLDRRQLGGKLNVIQELAQSRSEEIKHYAWTCHISYPTYLLKKIGGFWEEMKGSGYEDLELAMRAHRTGCRFRPLNFPPVIHLDHAQSELQAKHAPRNKCLFAEACRDRVVVRKNNQGALS